MGARRGGAVAPSGYALLVLPAANRVYSGAAVALTRAELAAVDQGALGGRLTDIDETAIAGVRYVTFATTAAEALDDQALDVLANLSSMYALFEIVAEHPQRWADPESTAPQPGRVPAAAAPEPGLLLRPVELRRLDRLDDDLLTIQRYPGKTNEHFTKLLLNVTLMASAYAPEMTSRRLLVVDPLCGRGTTLNQALVYGYDAVGIELDRKDTDAYSTFVRTWLRRKRLKHRVEADGPLRRDRRVLGRRLHVRLSASKEEWSAGDAQELVVLTADTTAAADLLPPGRAHVVVADLPYGVQHGSRTAHHDLARSPRDLLAAAVPGWAALLRPGGALGLAWNANVASREEVAAVVAGAGLDVREEPAYRSLRHRVDQAIVRDVLVARRP